MATKLDAFIRRKKLSHREFARLAGIKHLHPMVGLWCKGEQRPGLDTAFAIERATGGAIPASYWLSVKPKGRRSPHLPQR